MLAGRTLLREINQKEKFVLTTKLLVDPTGKKMGKSEGNMIALTDAPEEMYGKVMSWTDGMIVSGFELCTDVSEQEIEAMKQAMEAKENPMQFKRRLAHEIVKTFLGEAMATQAEEHFSKVHQAHEVPEEIPEIVIEGEIPLVEILARSGLVSSKTDARRQIEQGAVKVNGEIVKDMEVTIHAPTTIQKGKRHFVRVVDKPTVTL
jgi:tyrosyl-tRNA synthetase